ncbi:MAG: hypothetical protein GY726_12925 [Proteobacteria bacterium]|nr:hypothetical protein [Pseudomonadota bacterium]
MAILRTVLGPKSKYEKDLPYTYEAKFEFVEGGKEYNSCFADTICGLIERLNEKHIRPEEVAIYEIFDQQEKKLDVNLCLSADKQWLSREELCESFKHHYEGHIFKGGCTFADRNGASS